MPQLGNLDYLVNALLGFVCGAALLAASGVLTRSWVDFSSAEWGLELDRRATRRLRAGVISAGLAFIGLGIFNLLRM